MFGFLNVYKPKGKTSHDVVAILRRVTKIKQIGHTGTLDPFAEGVLPICIGKATRLIEYLADEKAYIGTVQFGKATSTYDIEGDVVNFADKKITRDELEKELYKFKGAIEQIPPIYSAIKVNGKKLYEYARKGENVEIKPREVNIYKLEVLNFDEEKQTAELLIECSKGTYIRSIANDLGGSLGCYGHLVKLVRIKAGMFNIENAFDLNELDTFEKIQSKLLTPIEYLDYPKYELNEYEKEKVSHGNPINIDDKNGLYVLIYNNSIAGIAQNSDKVARLQKVFL